MGRPRSAVPAQPNGGAMIEASDKPEGARSPNLADAVAIAFNPPSRVVWANVWERLAA